MSSATSDHSDKRQTSVSFDTPHDPTHNNKRPHGSRNGPGRQSPSSSDFHEQRQSMKEAMKRARVSFLSHFSPTSSVETPPQLKQSESTDDGY